MSEITSKTKRRASPGNKLLLSLAELGLEAAALHTLGRRVCREVESAFQASAAQIDLENPEVGRLEFLCRTEGQADVVAPVGGEVVQLAWRDGNLQIAAAADGKTWLCALPLKMGKKVIGVLTLEGQGAGLTAADSRILSPLASLVARLLAHRQRSENLALQSRKLEALLEAGEALISPDPLPEILKRISSAVQSLFGVQQCSVMLLNERRELVLSAVSGGSAAYAQRPHLSLAGSLLGEVAARRQPVQVFDVKRRRPAEAEAPTSSTSSAMTTVPVFFQGNLIGLLNLYGHAPKSLAPEDHRTLEAFAGLCGVAIGNAQRYERIVQADHQLRQADRLATLGALSAEIAHEVRNPVNVISMLLHSLREDKAVIPARERDISIILEKLEHINRIVSQMLDLSRQREAQLEWIDVNVALDNLILLIQHAASVRGVVIRRGTASPLPLVLFDRGHLDQVLLNLLMNAMEAMPNGGVLGLRAATYGRRTEEGEEPRKARRGRPRRGEEPKPEGVAISVSDTGPGLDPAQIETLFEPFSSGRKHGTGLGLFVSRKLLTPYGAAIRVKSASGQGATFTVEIPVDESSLPNPGATA